MDATAGKSVRHRRHLTRAYPEHSHRGRNDCRLCNRLRRLCALWFLRACTCFRPAWHCRLGDPGGGPAAWTGAGRARPDRRLYHAGARLNRPGELLGALSLSRGRHRRGLRARAHADVALARGHCDCAERLVDPAGHRQPTDRHSAAARAACRGWLRARGRAYRLRLSLWAIGRIGPHRNRVLGGPSRLSAGCRSSGAGHVA